MRLPQNLDAEKATLGALLLDSDITFLALPSLRPEYFMTNEHQGIYTAIQEVVGVGVPVDFITVSNKLQEDGKLELVGGVSYLTELMQSTPTSLHIEYYAEIVKSYYKLRSLILTAQKLIVNAESASPETVAATLDSSLESLYEVFRDIESDNIKTSRELMEEFWEDFEDRFNNPGSIRLSTGYVELDAITGGFNPTDLVVVAGRPSWGKTSFIMNSMLRLGQSGIPSVLFAYEMSRLQTQQRFLAIKTGINLQKVKTASGMSQSEMDTLVKSVGEFAEYPIYIDDNAAGDIYYLTSSIRRYVQQFDTKVVYIDYLQRIPILSDDWTNEVGRIATTLKTLAKTLGITVVLVSQLNRSVESERRKPRLSDLRQSGRIEEDADIVIFVYREPKGETPEDTEILVDKNRNGPIGSFQLYFEAEATRFIGRE